MKSVTLSSGALAKLVFTTQPDGAATGGTVFPQQPVVTAEDSAGNTVRSYSGTVSLSIKTGTSGASLSGCSGSLSSGVTTFSGCKIDKSGTYVLTASDGTLSVDSASFTVSVGPAAQLVFTQQPDGSPTGGVAFPQQPKVAVEDAGGNVVTSDTSTVSLAITTGTPTTGGPGTLSGCSGAETSGVVSFSGCSINTAGTGYKLHASDGTLTPTDSNAFNVSVGPAAQLAFTQQPDGSPTGGVAFPQQPKVAVEDAGGNVVTSDTSTVSLAITTGTPTTGGPGTLSGCSGAETSGVVSFSDCSINTAGTGYKLHASDGTLTPTDSNAFNVSVGPAAQLAFTQQPDGAATAGQPFPQQPKVTVEDAGGNIVTTDSSTVSLSITSGTPSAGGPGTLSGCSGTETGGVVSFTGCSINTAGTGYKLHATDGTLTPTDSASFTVSNVGATSVVEAKGPSPTVTTGSISPVNGSTYLVFVYCSGQTSACNGTSARASVSSPAFSSVTFDDAVGTGTSKDCLEVFTATGISTSGTVTVSGASGQNIGFVNVVQLSPGAKAQNGPGFPVVQGSTSPATASLSSPPSNYGEVVPVAVADGNGLTAISVQTPATGMNMLGNAQQDGTVGADLWVFFDSTAQSNASFALNPTNPLNGWATFAIEVG